MKSVVKHSYIKGASGKARAKAHVNYIQYRRGEDREDGKPREFFDANRDNIAAGEVKRQIDDQERSKVVVHKLILSPGLQSLDVREYTRVVMEQVGRNKGLDLNWSAVLHKNTDHDHAHIIAMGKDKNGREVMFNKDDYDVIREAGDRYMERKHFDRYLERDSDRVLSQSYERDSDQVLKQQYQRAAGDDFFERLMGDLVTERPGVANERTGANERNSEFKLISKPYTPKPWDKDEAIKQLPGEQKIEIEGNTYCKFSAMSDLQKLAERATTPQEEQLTKEQLDNLRGWIDAKSRHGEDYHERRAEKNWDKKEEKKRARSTGIDEREWKKFDKDMRDALRAESGEIFRGSYKQHLREQQGRLAPEHGDYVSRMENKRIEDLIERFPDQREALEKQRGEFQHFDQERQMSETKNKWQDFDALLGEKWKSPEKHKEQEQVRHQGAESQMQNEHIQRQEHEKQTGDQSEREEERQRDDDAFGRGER